MPRPQFDNIAALQTRYGGRYFRSRAEARWAVFMDRAGVPWEYEPEGYELGDGTRYLPDFWLPNQDVFFEVKGAKPEDWTTQEKALLLARYSGKDVIVAWGDIGSPPGFGGRPCRDCGARWGDDDDPMWLHTPEGQDNFYFWCQCPKCGKVGICFNGYSDRLSCTCDVPRKFEGSHLPLLHQAYLAARSERFGENYPRRVAGR